MTEHDDTLNAEKPTPEGAAFGSRSLDELVAALDHDVAASGDPVGVSPAGAAPAAAEGRYVVFMLGPTRYAAAVGCVIEIATVPETTPVPNVPDWVRGVINLRGEILAVLELRRIFGLEPLDPNSASRMLVARAGGDELTAGLVVDAVTGVTVLDPNRLREPTAPIEEHITEYLLGVEEQDGRLLAVLDLEKLLTSQEVRCFEAA